MGDRPMPLPLLCSRDKRSRDVAPTSVRLPLLPVELILELLAPDPVFELDLLALDVLVLKLTAQVVAKTLSRLLLLRAELIGDPRLIALRVGLARSRADRGQHHRQGNPACVCDLPAGGHRKSPYRSTRPSLVR